MEAAPVRASTHQLGVVAVRDLTPRMRRVTVHAPTLASLALRPAQDLGLVLTDDSGRPGRRRYTLRHVDRAAGTVDLDGILHGHGPGARWFADVAVGDHAEAIGPRGKLELQPADWHLFVGDEAGLPAFAELARALPGEQCGLAIIEVTDAADEVAVDGVDVRWVHRGDRPPGSSELLAAALGELDEPTGVGAGYLLGESRAVVALRPELARLGLEGPAVFLKGYWNVGRAAR